MGRLSNMLTGFGTVFGTISVDNGYQLDVAESDPDFVFDETKSYPAIMPVVGWGDYSEKTGNMSDVGRQFTIYGYLKNEDALQSTAAKLIEDMTRCIGQNQTLNGVCDWIDIVGAGLADDILPGSPGYPPGFVYPYGCVKVLCRIEYQINNADGG